MKITHCFGSPLGTLNRVHPETATLITNFALFIETDLGLNLNHKTLHNITPLYVNLINYPIPYECTLQYILNTCMLFRIGLKPCTYISNVSYVILFSHMKSESVSP